MSRPTPQPDYTTDERKEDFVREITLYIGNRRLDEALAREELAQLEGIERHLALSKNLILAAATISRKWKREGCKFAVFTLISLLSDNGRGMCILSIKRMAEVLGRTERRVSEAIDHMDTAGVIGVERTDGGLPRAFWPLVPRAITDMSPAATWFVDALSDTPPPRGRPRLVSTQGTPSKNPNEIKAPKNTPSYTTKYPAVCNDRISLRDLSNRAVEGGAGYSKISKLEGDGARLPPATRSGLPRPPRNTGGAL